MLSNNYMTSSQALGMNRGTPNFQNNIQNQNMFNRSGSQSTTFAKTSSIAPFQNDPNLFKNSPSPNLFNTNTTGMSSSSNFLQTNQNLLNQNPLNHANTNNLFAAGNNNIFQNVGQGGQNMYAQNSQQPASNMLNPINGAANVNFYRNTGSSNGMLPTQAMLQNNALAQGNLGANMFQPNNQLGGQNNIFRPQGNLNMMPLANNFNSHLNPLLAFKAQGIDANTFSISTQQNQMPGAYMGLHGGLLGLSTNEQTARNLAHKIGALWNRSADHKRLGESEWISIEKFFGPDFQTNLSFGNVWRDKNVRNLEHSVQQLVIDIERRFEENRRKSMQIDNIKRETDKTRESSKMTLEEATKDVMLFHLKMKNFVGVVEEQKQEIFQYYELTRVFDSFTEVLRKGMVQPIDIPSQFLFRSIERLKKKVEQLSKVILEIEVLSKYPEYKDDSRTKYEFFLKLVDNLFQYFKAVSANVIHFNEKLGELKRKMVEQNNSLSNKNLEDLLNPASQDSKHTTITNTLKFIIEKIEGDKLQKLADAQSQGGVKRGKDKEEMIFSFKS